MPMVLADQVAIVTGAGRGIGKAIALRLARDGANVGVMDIDGKSAEATANEIQQMGRGALAAAVDVADYDAVRQGIGELAAGLGRLDILINNAGIEKRAPFLEIDPADWRRQLDVNLTGTFYCTQVAAREMAKRKYGR